MQLLDNKINSNGKIHRDDLRDNLISFGILLDSKYIDIVINELLDKRQLSLIDWREFIRIIRGPIIKQHQNLIEDIFYNLSTNNANIVTFDELAKGYNGDEESLQRLIKSYQSRGLKKASIEGFVDYYSDLSASLDDESFKLNFNYIWPANGLGSNESKK